MSRTKIYITKYGGYHGAAASLDDGTPVFRLSHTAEEHITARLTNLSKRSGTITTLDRVSKLALASALHTCKDESLPLNCAVIAASARGATNTLEQAIHTFHTEHRVAPLTSPLTTAGGIASTIARMLHKTKSNPITIGTSMACASFFEALLIAQSLLLAKKVSRAIVVGAEAPLTPFTIAQMKALKIYSPYQADTNPCRPFSCITEHKNSLVLGEGAGCFLLETEESLEETQHTPVAQLDGIGFSQELTSTLTGMTDEGTGYLAAMKQALTEASITRPDLIIAHAAGTVIGDGAEQRALTTLFASEVPAVFSTKHETGHTFGASGALSALYALDCFNTQQLPQNPSGSFMQQTFHAYKTNSNRSIHSCLINASGFGGVTLSVVLSRPHS